MDYTVLSVVFSFLLYILCDMCECGLGNEDVVKSSLPLHRCGAKTVLPPLEFRDGSTWFPATRRSASGNKSRRQVRHAHFGVFAVFNDVLFIVNTVVVV